jgi:hypothetical protein
VREFVEQFMSNFSRPLEPGRELIPKPWRIPFFVGMAVLSLVALALLLNFVVIPAIHAQQPGTSAVPEQVSPQ